MGITIAGMENRNVTKMKIAFTIAAATIINRVHSRPLAWESYREPTC